MYDMGLAHIDKEAPLMTTKLTKTQNRKMTSLPTKSAKIRYLTSLDWSRSQIADKLKIRYQHVRNVQITPVTNPKA
jgi:hypothetical protein